MVGKLKMIIAGQLKRGMTPEQVALTVAVGAVVGLLPVPGATVLMCALAAVVLRLNHALIQVVNYAVYPLQLALMGGYYALGVHWFGDDNAVEVVSSIAVVLRENFWAGLWSMRRFVLDAMMVWMITSPAIAAGLYLTVRTTARRFHRLTRRPLGAQEQVAAAPEEGIGFSATNQA